MMALNSISCAKDSLMLAGTHARPNSNENSASAGRPTVYITVPSEPCGLTDRAACITLVSFGALHARLSVPAIPAVPACRSLGTHFARLVITCRGTVLPLADLSLRSLDCANIATNRCTGNQQCVHSSNWLGNNVEAQCLLALRSA